MTQWGKKAGIRPLRVRDYRRLRRFLLDPEVAHLTLQAGRLPRLLRLPVFWFLAQLFNTDHVFAIIQRSGAVIGEVRLCPMRSDPGTALLSIFIGEKTKWGQGYGSEAMALALDVAFKSLGFSRIELHVHAFNDRAIHTYEKLGFRTVGRHRKTVARGGTLHDSVIMSLLHHEYRRRASCTSGHERRDGDEPGPADSGDQ